MLISRHGRITGCCDADVHNVTLPGNATERVIEGLAANTEYLVSMYATSAMGNGPTSQARVLTRKCVITCMA